ncbi:MAG: tetratricopeptide repeat protein [Crocinitomicaceae bacterium]|nr:tetratricopeptide repeat protein [Crocinitomicaceae bacterium]
MKKLITALLTVLLTSAYAQVDLAINFEELYDAKKFDEIIKYKPKKNEELSAKALYYKGMAHYMKSEDKDANQYMDLALKKGPVDFDMFYYKGKLLFFADQFEESLPYFDKAIALLPSETDFYAGKGEAYYALENLDSALVYFQKAAEFPRCKPRTFLLMGEIYQEFNDNERALNVYSTALGMLDEAHKSYQNCSFNVGLMQQLTERNAEAKETFEKHVIIFPTDFHAISKLVQTYYSLTEFEKAILYKQKLYAAHQSKNLPDELKEMFCFDQFIWNGKRVMAFEMFDEPNEPMFVKHHFYVLDENGKTEYRIDSESSYAIRMNGPESKYVLCLVKGQAHFTYWQFVFDDNYKYTDLKKHVLDILNEKVKPGASFIPGVKNN